jgi:hypothetical protein
MGYIMARLNLEKTGATAVNGTSFADIAIVACGTMRVELRALKEEGFLDTGTPSAP